MGLWYDETFDDQTRLGLRVEKTLFSGQSDYQKIEVIETVGFGRVLVIDNVFMTSEYDEFLYHEMLAHPALTTAPRIERVLVIGSSRSTSRPIMHPPASAFVPSTVAPPTRSIASLKLMPKIPTRLP